MDYYTTLESQRGATQDEIKSAYRAKAKDSHPDRNPGDETGRQQIQRDSECL